MSWLKKHWKSIASGICGVASVGAAVIPGGQPIALGVAGVCAILTATHVLDQKDVERGKELGEGIAGVRAKLEQLRDHEDTKP